MNRKNTKTNLPTTQDVEDFRVLSGIFTAMFNEMKQFSKNKQNISLNELKVKKINEILNRIKKILSKEPTSEFLEILDDGNLPTNSDAVLILSQYYSALNQFESKYYYNDDDFDCNKTWHTQ